MDTTGRWSGWIPTRIRTSDPHARAHLSRDLRLRSSPRADRARAQVVSARGAPLAAEQDDLEMDLAPVLAREQRLEVALHHRDVLRAREAPAPGKAVDVRVDRKRG